MLLRSITKHIKDQNWFAVLLDFLIVVVGILIAFQITNWNEERAVNKLEKELLIEIKHEIEADTTKAIHLRDHFENVHAAGKRSLVFMDSDGDCGDACWPVLADFFHASHWFPVAIKRTVFDEMRRQGLPRSREVIASVETYHSRNYVNALILDALPTYRELVRSLMPVAVHEAYWSSCWRLENGVEFINYDACPSALSNDIAAQVVASIVDHPEVRPTLTFWFSEVTPTAGELENQIEAAMDAIAAIDKEIEAN